MIVKVGDAVKIMIRGKTYWGRVTNFGKKVGAFDTNRNYIYYVEIFEYPNWGVVMVREKDILEVFIPEEKVNFT